jgi:hypothetical protein
MSVVYAARHSGTYILGSQAPIAFSPAAIRAIFGSPAASADLRGAPDFPAHSTAQWVSIIRGSVWLTDNQVNAYTGAGPLITDDHPLTEYFLLEGYGSSPALFWLGLVVIGLLALLTIAAAVEGSFQTANRHPARNRAPAQSVNPRGRP